MRVHRVQQLPVARHTLERRFGVMAEPLLFRTNDPRLLAAAETSFGRFPVPGDDREPLVINLFRETRPGLPAADEDGGGGRRRTGSRGERARRAGGVPDAWVLPAHRAGLGRRRHGRHRRRRGGRLPLGLDRPRRPAGPLFVHRGDRTFDARQEPRLHHAPRGGRGPGRGGHRPPRARGCGQVDAGDGLRPARVRGLRRGRRLRPGPGIRARAVGDAVDAAAAPRRG